MKVKQLFYLAGLLGMGGVLMTAVLGWFFVARHHDAAVASSRRIVAINGLALDMAQANIAFKRQVQEWKDLLLRGHDASAFAKYKDGFDKQEKATDENVGHAAATAKALGLGDIAARLDGLLQEHRSLGERYRAALAAADPADRDFDRKTDSAVKGMDRPSSEALTKLTEETNALAANESTGSLDTLEEHKTHSALFLSSSVAGGMAVFVLLFVAMQRAFAARVGGDVERAVSESERIASGDLAAAKEPDGAPPGSLLDSIAKTRVQLAHSVSAIQHAASAMGDNVAGMSTMSAQMSATLESQAESMGTIAASVEEISQSVQSVSGNAADASEVSEHLNGSTKDTMARIESAIGSIKQVADDARDATQVVTVLNRHADDIRGIVGTIKDIADQTNLLALNAAIEAARAGESGRGFAVVADEVRKLAERTAASTQEVGAMIAKIEDGTRSAVVAMEQVAGHANESAGHADAVGTAMQDIYRDVERNCAAARDISVAVAEQSAALALAADSLAKVNATTEEAHHEAAALAGVAQELGGLERNLKAEVAHFRL